MKYSRRTQAAVNESVSFAAFVYELLRGSLLLLFLKYFFIICFYFRVTPDLCHRECVIFLNYMSNNKKCSS